MHTTLKTALITFVSGLLFVASLPLSATLVSAQGTGDSRSVWSGLWSGANLNLDRYLEHRQPSTAPAGTAASPPAQAVQTLTNRYVAMGDSVAAGAGLPLVAAPTSYDTACKRSPESYPYIVAQAQGLELVHVACSGAKATNLLLWQGIRDQPNPSRQISYIFAGGTPGLVSITAGANDMYWTEYVAKCYRTGVSCGPETRRPSSSSSLDYDTRSTDRLLQLLRGKWDLFFTELEIRSGGTPPTVVVTGYYDPFSPQCQDLAPDRLTQAELEWVHGRIDALNRTLQDAVASRPYARFAPVDFSGHDICSADSWVQGLDRQNGSAPIHPTAEGQRVMADAVLNVL